MKRKSAFSPEVGASSILMIFVVLCLTTFGVLSYVTANADQKISAKNAESAKNYYKAYASVQSKLQRIDSALLAAKTDSDAEAALSSVDGVTIAKTGANKTQVSFSEQVDTNRKISVVLTINPHGSTPRYQIAEQKLISTAEEQDTGDETLPLWQGSSTQ